MYRYSIPLTLFFSLLLTACTESQTATMTWQVQSSEKVSQTGDILSTPAADTEGWIPAQVPSTLMGILTANGIEPEALTAEDYASINKKQFEKSWWYRTTFHLPTLKEGKHVLLGFDGISYRANVWLNGQQIADSQEMAGPYRQFEFDVTQAIANENVLAVEVFRAQPGEPNIGFVDWNPRPADESMGIYREVRVKTCGNVALSHSAVRSRVNTETLKEAWLTVSTELRNLSDQPVEGVVRGTADGQPFSCPVTLAAGEKRRLVLPSEIHIDQPRLWWCHNMGKPERCDLHVEFEEVNSDQSKVISDSEDVRFGIREVHSYLTDEGYRGFTLNGKNILLRGAGWTDDIYLRDTPETNRQQLEYVRDMNLNTVRLEGFWGTSQNLYDLCDEMGLLVLVGWSCHWEWEDYLGAPVVEPYGGIVTPEKISLIAQSFEDQVMWLRYHPSIIGWFVGSDRIPKPELEKGYQQFLNEQDDRDYIISAKNLKSEVSGWSGTKMEGPYEYVGPSYWYQPEAPGGAFGFNTETGIGAQLPVKESLQKMLGLQLFPIDSRWNILCTASSSEMNTLNKLSEVIRQRFGETKDIDEYLNRADLLNYESTKAMFESFRVRRPHTTGIVQWMLNGARPGIYWQLYDYYKQPNASYYGVKKANTPVQLIYDYYTKAVYAVNETLQPASVKASMKLVSQEDGSFVISADATKESPCDIAPGTVVKVFDVDTRNAPAAFLFLRLTDDQGTEIANNEYFLTTASDVYDWAHTNWVHTPIKQYASYAMLDSLCTKACGLSVKSSSEGVYEATVSNASDKVAFMIRLTAKDQNSSLILPAYWSDNYLTLAPGESRTVTCRMPSLPANTAVTIEIAR